MKCAVDNPVDVLKEGTVWIATTTQLNRSKMSERWLTLARERPPTINEVDIQERNVFLKTCKISNGVQRKVQDFSLANFEMVTSAYSSSSGTLGPNRSIIFRFSVHCAGGNHDFYTKDEHTMLAWVAALKQALCRPAAEQNGEFYAVTYKREDRHHRALGMTPSVARQASALLYVHEQSISLLHPLTEEALEHWPADTITQLVVNSGTQSLQLHVCDTCRPKDGGLVLVTCPTPAQQPATSMITSLPLQSCVRRSERELICEFVHVCEVQIPSNPDSRCPSSMSKGGSSLCGSCGNLFESSILSPQAVGQLMKTSACQQLSSIYSPGSLHGSRSLHEDSDRPGADPEGYMIMKSDDQAEKLDRSGTLPTRNNAPLPDTFRRTKSATFNSHTRLHRVSGHQNVAPARSWNSSARRNSPEAKPSKLASSEGESTYMEPTEVLRHRSHLPDCVPQLKPSAERTTSDQSYVSTNPSEHYASSTAHSRKTSVTSTQFEDSGHRETSESSNDTPRSSIVEEDISDTDEDGYSFMAFPEPAKPILRPSKSSKPDRALNAVDKSGLIKAAQRTRSSPSMLANATYPPRAGCPPTPRTRIASPSFSELERRAAVATAKVQQRRDEERGYVTPEPVTHRHHHHPKANSSSASLPLQLVTDPNHPDGSYMTLVGNGARFPRKSESTSALPTSGSPDSGIGPETLGSCESDGRYTNRAAIIKKRVMQTNMLQKSRFSDDYEEQTRVLVRPLPDPLAPPLPPKPAAGLPPIEKSKRCSPGDLSLPPLPPKPARA